MPKTREFRLAADGKTADIWIYEEIDDWWGVSASWIRRELAEAPMATNVVVHINSPGGMVTEGVAIYNLLRNHDANVRVQVEGLAASAASIIAMAGDEIVAYEGSLFMVHEPWSVTRGFAEDHRATASVLDTMGESLADIYAKRTGQTREWCLEKMNAETWFSAKDAVAAGLADSMAEGKEAAAASFDLRRFQFKHAPPALQPAAPEPARAQQLTLPVAHADPEETHDMKAIAKAMGLSENATEGEILAAYHDHQNKARDASAKAKSDLESANAERDAARAELETAKAHVNALEDAIGKKGDEAVGAARAHVANSAKLAEAEAKLKEQEAKAESDARAALIAKAKADGKITPAEEAYWSQKPVAELKAYLEVASARVPMGEATPPAADGSTPEGELTYQGKTYGAMSGAERVALSKADHDLWGRMRAAWEKAGHPIPDSAG